MVKVILIGACILIVSPLSPPSHRVQDYVEYENYEVSRRHY